MKKQAQAMSLDEVREQFLAESRQRMTQIKKQIRTDTLMAKQNVQQNTQELAQYVQSPVFQERVRTLLDRIQSPAMERRQELSVHICTKRKTYDEIRQGFYIIRGQNKKGRERMAKNNRRSFWIWTNKMSPLEIEVYNDMVELGIL